MELQRTILAVVFAASLALLWDKWNIAHGKPTLFLPSPQKTLVAGATAGGGDGAAGGANAGANGLAGAPSDVPTGSAAPAAAASAGAVVANGAAAGVPADAGAVPGASAPVAVATSEIVHIETDVLRLDFDAQGAVITRAELLQEKGPTQWTGVGLAGFVTGKKASPAETIVLLDRAGHQFTAESGLTGVAAGNVPLPNHHTHFDVLPGPRALDGGADSLQVRFEAREGGVLLRKTFVLHKGRYDIEVRHEVQNVGAEPVTTSLYLQLTHDDRKDPDESRFASTYSGPAIYNKDTRFTKVSYDDIGNHKAPEVKPAKEGWVSLLQHYFLTAWVPQEGADRDVYFSKLGEHTFGVGSKLPLGQIAPGASVARDAVLWVGPQDQGALAKVADGLELVADYGRLSFIARPLFDLLGLLYRFVGNWGWAIVLLTILIKAALYPLAAAGFKSMARMKEMAPRLEKIKQQYGDDKQRQQQAMMELYKTEKINPLGGCLPILIQIPVFIALYWVLLSSVELRNAPWILWIHDLATPDPWFVLPALMMLTSWIQYKLNPTPTDPVQAKMMAIMPFVFGVMFFFFPSGLVLYYVLNNSLSILQQWRINKVIGAGKAAA